MEARLADWLVRVRRLALAANGVLLAVAFSTGERPVAALVVGAALAAAEAVRALVAGRAPVRGVADLVGLSALLAAWAEPHQPLTVFFLVDVALFATFASRAAAWAAAGGALAGHALALALPVALGVAHHSEAPVHLAAHAVTFGLAVVALTLVLSQVAEAGRADARALLARTEERDRAARLAAIGTLAAGVAHELATPLGSVALLADEVAHDPALVPTLRGQIDRCRAILDRLLARAEAPDGQTDDLGDHVRRWVAEWRLSAPEVPVWVDADDGLPPVRGAPEGWRAALWTVLDNARRAGPPISVTVRAGRVVVGDAGPGADPDVAARVGEPFVSGWGGAGLGLYAARTFARAVGGDVRLERGPSRAILELAPAEDQ